MSNNQQANRNPRFAVLHFNLPTVLEEQGHSTPVAVLIQNRITAIVNNAGGHGMDDVNENLSPDGVMARRLVELFGRGGVNNSGTAVVPQGIEVLHVTHENLTASLS